MPTKSELKYHIVWCTKYRRKVLTKIIQNNLKELIVKKTEDLGYGRPYSYFYTSVYQRLSPQNSFSTKGVHVF